MEPLGPFGHCAGWSQTSHNLEKWLDTVPPALATMPAPITVLVKVSLILNVAYVKAGGSNPALCI